MKVADLHQHFTDLGRLLSASGAKGVAADLAAVCQGLEPFRDFPLKNFAEFLVKAEGYYSRGEVPATPTKGGRGGKQRTTGGGAKVAKPDVATLTREVRELYDRAGDPSVTPEQIDEATRRLGGLTKDELAKVAEALEMKGMKSKKKDVIQEAIRQRILARKGTSQRVGMIDRSPFTAAGAPTLPPPAGGQPSPAGTAGQG
jgi:hypothetical protein